MKTIEYRPIGIIHSPFKIPKGSPIQPSAAQGVAGTVEIFVEFAEGLDNKKRGLFATRAPSRPNPIGFSVVRLTRMEGNILYIQNVDVVDDTPLLDVKPYVPAFDVHPVDKIGWMEDKTGKIEAVVDDGRFIRD